MDIKLKARLSAYSKVDSLSCDHEYVTKSQIDELFKNMDEPSSVTKTEIDNLFTEIDEPESVTKDQIDQLFVTQEQPVDSVSYKDIDSLFN